MLTPDVRVEGFTSADWTRLFAVLRPVPARGAPLGEALRARRGGVVAVTTGPRLRKLISTTRGRLPIAGEPWPAPLGDLAERHGADWAVELGAGTVDELVDRWAARLGRRDTATAQVLHLLAVLREMDAEGAIRSWPLRPSSWVLPSERVIERALDALCADGRCLALGVFDQGALYTAVALRRRGGAFDLLLGPDELRRDMGLVSGDWTRDHRHLARAIERRVGPLALGCYGERDTFQSLARSHAPGAWAVAAAARDIVLSPAPPAVAIPLGVDLGRAVLGIAKGLADRLGATAWLGAEGPLAPAVDRLRALGIGSPDLQALLGFDPLALLRRLLYRGPTPERLDDDDLGEPAAPRGGAGSDASMAGASDAPAPP
ncbi:MAG: hypothetical protein IT376_10200 [Polyangiaceae bacterium]|nr:hypothetical protein [Polyangiaceae bacterium]